jgi:hypothetical protein
VSDADRLGPIETGQNRCGWQQVGNTSLARWASKPIADAFAGLGMAPKSNTPAELVALIKSEAATWGPIIRSTGFKPLE